MIYYYRILECSHEHSSLPMKQTSHITIDLYTLASKMERWTVDL